MSALVLVADGDPFNLRLLQEICEGAGHRTVAVRDGRAAVQAASEHHPDLALVSADLPTLDGFDVLRTLKADPALADIPVLLLTAEGDVELRNRGLNAGADDFLTKPYRAAETEQRLRNALRLRSQGETAPGDSIDPLTRAGSREQLTVTLEYELTRAARYRHPLSCILVRVRNLEGIARAGGEQAAEGVVVGLASGLRACIRAIDHLFRSGPGEFVAVLPETDAEGAETVLGRIHARAADHSLWGVETEPRPEVVAASSSFGGSGPDTGTSLLERALAALDAPGR